MWYLVLYGIVKLQEKFKERGIDRGVTFEDVVVALYKIPLRKYGVALYSSTQDFKEVLERLVEEGYVRVKDGKYEATEAGMRIAKEVETADIGYVGFLKKTIDKSIALYLTLELLAVS